jgi:hypothetical protein
MQFVFLEVKVKRKVVPVFFLLIENHAMKAY